MGIPRLLAHLDAYAQRVQVRASPQPSNDLPAPADGVCDVVIDGPGFAYHAYHLCALARRSTARHGLAAVPSYKDVASAALEWLLNIEQCGLHVKAIFFDGMLPAEKHQVRLHRLEDSLHKVVEFKTHHNAGSAQRSAYGSTVLSAVVPAYSLAKLLKLPAPPFLVPAVIEALLKSRFKGVTTVVPGEADVYCARYAKENGAIIMTGDSDLLVYDLGLCGSVMLFRDVEISEEVIQAKQYIPCQIANRLGLSSLIPFAFVLKQSYGSSSIPETIRAAKQVAEDSPDYTAFIKEYSELPETDQVLAVLPLDVLGLLRAMDPRPSEYVVQMMLLRAAVDPGTWKHQPLTTPMTIFLPYLFDDPSRATAWTCGQPIRNMGYSLLAYITHLTAGTREYGRRGLRIADMVLPALDANQLVEACQWLKNCFETIISAFPKLSPTLLWRICGINILCQEITTSGKQLPTQRDIEWLLASESNHEDPSMNWSYIHLTAQLHSILYSIRMLKQLSQVALALATTCAPTEKLCSGGNRQMQMANLELAGDLLQVIDAFRELQQACLVSLPPLEDMFPASPASSLSSAAAGPSVSSISQEQQNQQSRHESKKSESTTGLSTLLWEMLGLDDANDGHNETHSSHLDGTSNVITVQKSKKKKKRKASAASIKEGTGLPDGNEKRVKQQQHSSTGGSRNSNNMYSLLTNNGND